MFTSHLDPVAGLRNLLFTASAAFAGSGHAQVVISEVLYDASGTDNGAVFVELYGVPGTALDGLFLEGVNGNDGSVYRSIALGGVIPGDGVFLIADDAGDGSSQVTGFDLLAEVDFQNGPDSVVLRNATGVLDALGYGDFSSAIFAGEGAAAPDVPSGSSLARFNPFTDTNNNAADFLELLQPTPGHVDVAAVPLPAPLLLVMSGLLGLFTVARRRAGPGLTRLAQHRIMQCHETRGTRQPGTYHCRQLAWQEDSVRTG